MWVALDNNRDLSSMPCRAPLRNLLPPIDAGEWGLAHSLRAVRAAQGSNVEIKSSTGFSRRLEQGRHSLEQRSQG